MEKPKDEFAPVSEVRRAPLNPASQPEIRSREEEVQEQMRISLLRAQAEARGRFNEKMGIGLRPIQ